MSSNTNTTEPGSSSSQQDRNTPGTSNSKQPEERLPFNPAGLELLHQKEAERIENTDHVFFLAVHWALIRGGLRRTNKQYPLEGTFEISPKQAIDKEQQEEQSSSDGASASSSSSDTKTLHEEILADLTESPEPGWREQIDSFKQKKAAFFYVNPLVLDEGYYCVEFYSLGKDCVVTLSNRFSPSCRRRYFEKDTKLEAKDAAAAAFSFAAYVRFGPEHQNPVDIYFNASALEKRVFDDLFQEIGLPVMAPIPKNIEMYADKKTQQSQQQKTGRNIPVNYGSYYYEDYQSRPRRPMPDPGGIGGPL